MATNLAINQLISKTPASTDIIPVADPSTGIAGKSLISDIVNYGLPSQASSSGKFLTTNGATTSWADILGSVNYQGTWDASTNTPSLASGVGTKGFYYVVSADGSTNLDGVTSWKVGDWAIYNGTAWQKVDNTDAVASVNGQTGTVVLGYSDVGSPSTSGTNATGTWAIDITGNSANVTGIVAIANGGTGTSNGSITGTGALTFAAGGTNQHIFLNPTGTGAVYADGVPIRMAGTGYSVSMVEPMTNVSTGAWNVGIGGVTGVTTGSYNTATGYGAISGIFTSSYTTALGYQAGQKNSVGAGNLLNDPEGCTYIGAICRGKDNYETNAIVIGYDARGKGSNTTVLGNSSTTQTWLGGGELRLPGSSSGYVGLKGATAAGSTTYTLPSADGTSGQVLSTNGTGTLAWSTIATSGGTVTSVGGTGTVNGITLTGTVTSSGNLTLGGTLSGVSLTTQVSGTLPIANGGTGQTTASAAFNALSPLTTLGDVLYASGASTSTRLAGNTTTTKQFLSQTGTGSASAAPAWSTVSKSDVGLSNVENTALSTWAGSSNITTLGTVATGTWSASTIAVDKGGTGATTLTGYVKGNGTSAFTASSTVAGSDVSGNISGNAANVTGTVAIANGGTGQTTANAALNALLPSQTSQSGKYLKSDGTNTSWSTVSVNAAGNSGEVQYNSSGSFAGAAKLKVNLSTGWPDSSDGSGNLGLGDGVYTLYGSSPSVTGSLNIAIGANAGRKITSGSQNICIGGSSGYGLTEGGNNIYIGRSSNYLNTTGSYNVCIGDNSYPSSSSVSSQVTLGNDSTSSLRCAVTTITSYSDVRDKTNITPMPSVLSFIASLNPVRFDWWMRNGAKVGVSDYGFIAQELQQAQANTGFDWAQLVYDDNPEKLEISPGKLIPILVKAIQELAAKVAALEAAV